MDLAGLAQNPWFRRFGEVLEMIQLHIENDQDFEHLLEELEDMEESITEAGFSDIEEKFVRRKRGGALKAASRAFKKWVRGHMQQYRKKLKQGKRWAKTHKSRITRMAKTARTGFRRVTASADSEQDDSYTGRMESVSDSHQDMGEQRRLAGITPSQPRAAFTTSVMTGHRPSKPLTESTGNQDIKAFRRLAGL
jgi:ketol-acid reductoisomerase